MNPAQSITEKRRFTRVPFACDIVISQEPHLWIGTVVDISFNGILVNAKFDTEFDPNATFNTTVTFDNGEQFNVTASLIHHNNHFYGFRYKQVSTEDLHHLRNLIMLNLGSDTACERELLSLFSYHQ